MPLTRFFRPAGVSIEVRKNWTMLAVLASFICAADGNLYLLRNRSRLSYSRLASLEPCEVALYQASLNSPPQGVRPPQRIFFV